MRTFIFYSYLWLYLISVIPRKYKVERLKKQGRLEEKEAYINGLVQKGVGNLMKIAGAELTVTGKENIPLDEPVLYVGNHQSNLDVPLFLITTPQVTGFVAKKEMEKVPFLSYWMKEKNCLFLDRGDVRAALKTIKEGTELLKEGHSLTLFPEGTRSNGKEMGEFRDGGLRMALKSGVKVVPVTIQDSYKIIGKSGKVCPGAVSIHYSKPIDPKEFKDTRQLSAAVLDCIQQHLYQSDDAMHETKVS